MEELVRCYRDKNLRRVKIKISPHSIDDGANCQLQVKVDRELEEIDGEYVTSSFSILWSGTDHDEVEDTEEALNSIAVQTMLLIKWSILNRYLARFIENQDEKNLNIIFRKYGSTDTERDTFYYYVSDNEFRIILPAPEEFRIQQHRLARRILLHLFYNADILTRDSILQLAHFDQEIVNQELNALLGSKVLELQPENQNNFFATLKARELYESESHSNQDIVFIIAACHSNEKTDEAAHQSILDEYKSVVWQNFGLTPIFQENEEPEENIYVDIFNYIDKCEFVIADITYDRFNCYVEIGYAMAKGKHIIGFKQKEWSDSKPKDERIPFDLFPIRFLDYSKGDVDDLREKLKQRIKAVIGRRSQ